MFFILIVIRILIYCIKIDYLSAHTLEPSQNGVDGFSDKFDNNLTINIRCTEQAVRLRLLLLLSERGREGEGRRVVGG